MERDDSRWLGAGEGFAPSVGTGRAKVTKECFGQLAGKKKLGVYLPACLRKRDGKQKNNGVICPVVLDLHVSPHLPFHNLAEWGNASAGGVYCNERGVEKSPRGSRKTRAG